MQEDGQIYFDENVSKEDRERLLKAEKELAVKELKAFREAERQRISLIDDDDR